jgi:hypothetical protein
MHRGELLDFYHGQFRDAAQRAWLNTDARRRTAHAQLAAYFHSQADPRDRKTWQGDSPRAISELPFHLTMANMSSESVEVLTDLAFIERKCALEMTYQLANDYVTAKQRLSLRTNLADRLAQFGEFVRMQAHLLSLHPELAFQQAANEPAHLAPARVAEHRWKSGSEVRPWLRWLNKSSERPVSVTINRHEGGISCCAESPDGLAIASGSRDKIVRIWDSFSGKDLGRLLHDSPVESVLFTKSGSHLVTGTGQTGWWGEVWIWDNCSGESHLCAEAGRASCLRRLQRDP